MPPKPMKELTGLELRRWHDRVVVGILLAGSAAFAAGVRSKVARIFLSKDFLRRFYRLNGTVSCGLHGGGGSVGLLWITPTPPGEDTAQIWEGDVQPCAPAIVTVTVATFVWNAVTPLPIAPLVAPTGPVPTASTAVTHQLDRR